MREAASGADCCLRTQVRFSEGGERFAAIGQGGLAAAWRLDAPTFTRSDSGPLARSDWCHQVLGTCTAAARCCERFQVPLWACSWHLCGGSHTVHGCVLSAFPINSAKHGSATITARK